MSSKPSKDTHFGFKRVSEKEKSSLVHAVFDSVANKYDIMNDVMSLGVHRLWKQHFVDRISITHHMKLLDVATGTGDIATKIWERSQKENKQIHMVLSDINEAMLNRAKARAVDANRLNMLEYCCADAEHLPFEDQSFDLYTIAFGLRNVTNIQKAIEEAHRILRPGGHWFCLEFSHVDHYQTLQKLYDLYSFNIIPKLGECITGDRAAYQYLVESIRQFPKADTLAGMLTKAGFSKVTWETLTFGVVAIHTGVKEA